MIFSVFHVQIFYFLHKFIGSAWFYLFDLLLAIINVIAKVLSFADHWNLVPIIISHNIRQIVILQMVLLVDKMVHGGFWVIWFFLDISERQMRERSAWFGWKVIDHHLFYLGSLRHIRRVVVSLTDNGLVIDKGTLVGIIFEVGSIRILHVYSLPLTCKNLWRGLDVRHFSAWALKYGCI